LGWGGKKVTKLNTVGEFTDLKEGVKRKTFNQKKNDGQKGVLYLSTIRQKKKKKEERKTSQGVSHPKRDKHS